MDEHAHHLQRLLSSDDLSEFTDTELRDLAALCTVEPADPSICDACAAYLVLSTRERDALNDETNFGPNPHHHPYPPPSWPIENQTPYMQDLAATVSGAYSRPWLFEPGDRVLCLYNSTIYGGVVQRIQIPGPIHDFKTVQVLLDDDTGPVQLGWWDPDHVERIIPHG